MTPITYKANSQHKNTIEKKMKELVIDKGSVVYYKVTAAYGSHPSSPDFQALKNKKSEQRTADDEKKLTMMKWDRRLATEFRFDAHTLQFKDEAWVKDEQISYAPVTNEIPKKAPSLDGSINPPRLVRLSINNPGSEARKALTKLETVGPVRVGEILAKGPFGSWGDLHTIDGITKEVTDSWQNKENDEGKRMVYLDGETVWK